jgi:NADPH:quinone reductase-like Zn-dependent oxidoreductase
VVRTSSCPREHAFPRGLALYLSAGAPKTNSGSNDGKESLMRQLQLVAHGKPADVIELRTVSDPAPGPEDVLVSMEAAPLNPSDFLLVRGTYAVRPSFPFAVGAEGVGRVTQTGSKVDTSLRGKRVLILPTYEQGT